MNCNSDVLSDVCCTRLFFFFFSSSAELRKLHATFEVFVENCKTLRKDESVKKISSCEEKKVKENGIQIDHRLNPVRQSINTN